MVATKALLKLTAADLMNINLMMVPQEMSLRAAARLLNQHQVSGAPVVDEEGVCVGVLSTTDFVRWAEGATAQVPQEAASEEYCQAWTIVEDECLPEDIVADHMTTEPVTVQPDTNIQQIARKMIDAHIHRVLVTDGKGVPIGIITTTDILAALAYAEPAAIVPQKGDSSWLLRQPPE